MKYKDIEGEGVRERKRKGEKEEGSEGEREGVERLAKGCLLLFNKD